MVDSQVFNKPEKWFKLHLTLGQYIVHERGHLTIFNLIMLCLMYLEPDL